ncbi:MAG: 1,4-alpha-glucan branching protein GlgB [Polyangiaceae bacterium]
MTTTPVLGPTDLHLLAEGTHERLYERLGAHPAVVDGVEGAFFGVWAPNAESVSVIGEWNAWNLDAAPLARVPGSGVYQGFVPGAKKGSLYKYHLVSRGGAHRKDKCDPVAFRQEAAPGTASIVWDLEYEWKDSAWMSRRAERNDSSAPISIYECHLGSFMRHVEEGGRTLTYAELATRLVEHVKKLGFTHVELMPLTEHPFYGSWGYETTGYFAATGRYGTPQDLMALIDAFHAADIGVILDWVPAHFPTDAHALAAFDGTHLYEHEDKRQGYHPEWNTAIFNYGRHEVRSFLLSSAMMWIHRFHADGLRVDGVSSMLYLDYGRREGEWIPNRHGGRENLEAVDFLRRFNEAVKRDAPGVLTIAEESTSWPMVTGPRESGGLGFDYKWDMGWMHDTLRYLSRDPIHRRWHHGDLTFRGLYAFSEKYVLPLSHDEVVHGKGSLFGKMAGDTWQKLANLRLLYAYMYSQPGKKLLFMGSEIAQEAEWNHDRSLDWHLRDDPARAGIELLVGELNRLYREHPSLHQEDLSPNGFFWLDADDAGRSTLIYERVAHDPTDRMLVLLNLTPVPQKNRRVGVKAFSTWEEVLNTDAANFGGSGHGNLGELAAVPVPWNGRPFSLSLTLPPLGALFLHKRPDPSPAPVLPAV